MIVVTGASGFIGSHLVTFLKERGHRVRGVDLVEPAFGQSDADEFWLADLRHPDACRRAVAGADEVYHLAADMGGIGYITAIRAGVARNNVLMDVHMLQAASSLGVQRYFYASSACVYPWGLQDTPDALALIEDEALPADPEPGYGWEKLFAEQVASYYQADEGLAVRVARFHNCYGPGGTYDGGREKAPAALCRKVALASEGGHIDVWGDGQQVRSFMYVTDCVEGIYRIAQSGYAQPLNLGTDEAVSIDALAQLVIDASGKHLSIRHVQGPQGVRGRNSDNTRAREVLGWEPSTKLHEGIEYTYAWVHDQIRQQVLL